MWEKPTLSHLLQDTDNHIVCLQETFYCKQDLSCLNTLHNDFQGIGTSTTDARDNLITGHPPGGVAILYRRKHAKCITVNLRYICDFTIKTTP